ncbi:MAG TPA: hypothetical protein VHP57_01915 [Acidimicrobiia bacterium]|nr:hypothetical protein [Acidimicrobiia bacterium]
MNTPARLSRRIWSLLCTAVTVAALLAGCGSSGSNSTQPPKTSTNATHDLSPDAAIDPAVGVATGPVRPVVAFNPSTFEGYHVYSSIPDHPVGVVYLFHGSGGGADIATKLETVDVLNTLISRGYGFVATESTNRTAKQWNVSDPSMTANADLARMARLRQHIVDTTAVDAGTPTFGIGMSNGSAFAALWAAASTKAGMPVRAVALYMAGPTRAVEQIGGLRVPTFMVVGQNDTRTSPPKERDDVARIAAAGIPTELHEVKERPVTAVRYLRIPGIDQATADAIVAAYRQAGFIDAGGNLTVALPKIVAGAQGNNLKSRVKLPASLTPAQRQAVGNETLAAIGEHQFNAEFKIQNADFFDAHRTR